MFLAVLGDEKQSQYYLAPSIAGSRKPNLKKQSQFARSGFRVLRTAEDYLKKQTQF
jgi:hypothetical protein